MSRDYLTRDDVLSPADRTAIRAWLGGSDLVGESPLTGMFLSSRGFAMTFTREGVEPLLERFPALRPFLERCVLAQPWHALLGPLESLKVRLGGVRVFYLNVLVVASGANVARHIDATLGPILGQPGRTPLVVSVAYLATPPGGALCLWRGDQQVAELVPQEGRMVCFRGELGHAVGAVDGEIERVSLVCEQYVATAEEAARIEPLKVTSRGRFGRVLAKLSGE